MSTAQPRPRSRLTADTALGWLLPDARARSAALFLSGYGAIVIGFTLAIDLAATI